ncbi:MAG: PEP-CTERM sorting domain-containing protein [Bryobacterales bacterium]|nr:PEP-CTERM sorting domain-containing protein [Bryobacterales bacterium]
MVRCPTLRTTGGLSSVGVSGAEMVTNNGLAGAGRDMSSGGTLGRAAFRAALLAAAAAASLSAAAVSFTITSGYTYVEGVAALFTSGELPGPSTASAIPVSVGSGLGFQTAYSTGSANFGTLKAFATAYSASPFVFPQTQVEARWKDTIHVFSPGGILPDGTPITVSFSLHLSDILTSITVGPGYTGSNAWAFLDGLGAVNFLHVYDSFGSPPAAYTVSGTYNTTVGADLLIGANLQANAGPQNADATADASNTGLFAMEILTPGASYTSASGTVYETSLQAVPEPGSFALAGIALGLAILRRGARKS